MCEVDFIEFGHPLDSDSEIEWAETDYQGDWERSSVSSLSGHSDTESELSSESHLSSASQSSLSDHSHTEIELSSESCSSQSNQCSDTETCSEPDITAEESYTVVEPNVPVTWYDPRFNSETDKKHWKNYLKRNCFYNVISVIDRRGENETLKTRHVPIYYKHNPLLKQKVQRFCTFSPRRLRSDIFLRIYYPHLKTYVNWPGVESRQNDHSHDSPYYCVRDYRNNLTPPTKVPKYYTVFAAKERYHKLYNCTNTLKFYCHPSEQQDVTVTATVLFPSRIRKTPHRYKYKFLEGKDINGIKNKKQGECVYQSELSSSDDPSTDLSDYSSDETVVYDEKSYNSTNSCTEGNNFFSTISKMNRLYKPAHSGTLNTLLRADLSEIISNPRLNAELKQVEQNPVFDSKCVIPERFSVKSPPLLTPNEARKSHLKAAQRRLDRKLMETVYQINKEMSVVKKLRSNYIELSRQAEKISQELNARETLDLARGTQRHLRRTVAMKIDKIEQDLNNPVEQVEGIKNENGQPTPESHAYFATPSTSSGMKSVSDATIAVPSTSSGTKSETTVKMEIGTDGHDISCDLLPPEVFKKYQCALCSKRYVDKRSFANHVESHTGKSYTCPKCPNRVFLNAQAYRKHAGWHAGGEKYYVCKECGKGFEFPYRLTTHLISHDTVELHCTIDEDCEKTFKHEADLRKHENFGHRLTKDFECEKCGKFFKSPQSRSAHMKSCTGPKLKQQTGQPK